MLCPCGSGSAYDACCGPFHSGAQSAPTALALMRSRYAAYVRADIDYIARTLAPESQSGFDRRSAAAWAANAQWKGLRIVAVERGEADDTEGVVEFVAAYRQLFRNVEHRERSEFRRSEDGRWLFVRGAPPRKVGRNDPCPCGSGKKFKQCCG